MIEHNTAGDELTHLPLCFHCLPMTCSTQLKAIRDREKERLKKAAEKEKKKQLRPRQEVEEEERQEREELEKQQQQEQEELNAEAEEDPEVAWTDRGIPDFAGTTDHDKRTRRPPVSAASLSASARSKLPSLDTFIGGRDENGEFPLSGLMMTCFNMMFPEKAVDLFVQKVSIGVFVWSHSLFSCTRTTHYGGCTQVRDRAVMRRT